MSPATQKQDFKNDDDYIKHLEDKVRRLEKNKEKLLDSLRIKNDKEKDFFVHLPESSLSNFMHMSRCDQKLLAILYWDKLTDLQKKVFTDHEEKDLQQEYDSRMQRMMTDPTKMRQYFLRNSAPILEKMIDFALDGQKLKDNDTFAFREVWEVLKGIIVSANNPAPMMDLRGKDISSQIDEILSGVAEGNLTFVEAKEYMSLISSGFNLQELPKLMAKLDALEMQ